MSLFTKPIETARKNRDQALADAAQWEAQAAAMRAEADKLNASANAAILEDESSAERITVQILTLQRKASAYEQATCEARRKASAAARDALSIEADELDKESAKLQKAADKHEIEVIKAKAALESLDECAYERVAEKSTRADEYGIPYTVTTSTGKAGQSIGNPSYRQHGPRSFATGWQRASYRHASMI